MNQENGRSNLDLVDVYAKARDAWMTHARSIGAGGASVDLGAHLAGLEAVACAGWHEGEKADRMIRGVMRTEPTCPYERLKEKS
jgi:hypothetical protein